MKVHSGHIYLDEKFDWKDLAKIFPDMFKLFLSETRQLTEDPLLPDIILYENMTDLQKNRKPIGFNREGKMRLMFFKNGRIELRLLRDKIVSNEDTKAVTERLSRFLNSKKIKNKVEYDKMYWIELKKAKK